MKRNYGRYRFFFAALLLFLTLFTPKAIRAYSEDDSRNVLILNSYHKGLSWTDQQTEGISGILGKAGFDCNIFVEYMDWKNYPTEENNVAECIIAKQRNGPVGTVKLAWLGQFSKFGNLDVVHQQ